MPRIRWLGNGNIRNKAWGLEDAPAGFYRKDAEITVDDKTLAAMKKRLCSETFEVVDEKPTAKRPRKRSHSTED